MTERQQAILTAALTGQPLPKRWDWLGDLAAACLGVALALALVALAAAIAGCL